MNGPPRGPSRPPPHVSIEDLEEEPRSGSFEIPASLGDLKKVRRQAEEFREEAKVELKREITRNEAFTALATILGCVATLMSAWFFIIREARAAADAGVQAVAQQAKATQAELERFQREAALRLERSESASNRTEVKVDALLEKFRVPNPAPMPKESPEEKRK